MPFKARVIGSIKRMPGLFDISGYRPAAYIGPGMIVSQKQLQYLVDSYKNYSTEAYQNHGKLMDK